jgi:hypothetical protein
LKNLRKNTSSLGHTEEQIFCKEKKLEKPVSTQKIELLPEEFFELQAGNYMKVLCTIERLKNRRLITWTAVITMVFALIASYLLIALSGLQYMQLPDKLIFCLGGSIIGSIMSTGMIVFKYQVQPKL